MQSSKIRALFLDFFTGKGHLVMPSFSLIPRNDPSLLLIGAGMAPLKPFFTGERKPPHTRIATCQKCVRTPDIERVGYTGRHATFFEMLGNFSFGDYFKEEAIEWAWELVRDVYRLPAERIWVSIYEDDDESFNIWRERIGVPAGRIVRLGKDDNFWEIGTGPCGPCSEIYYDLGPELGCGGEDCKPGCECDRYLEIWNLVFTQFNREPGGELTTLKQKNIDTGAGLERLATALQGVGSVYETDLFRPLIEHFASLAGAAETGGRDRIPLRIVSEHARGIAFLAAGGVLPSNEGRGYILRRLIRRAARHGRLIGLSGTFLAGAVPLLAELMGGVYPELKERRDFIMQVVGTEENRFQETLAAGIDILEDYIQALRQKGQKQLPGELAFKLYDTYGFPLDLTSEILNEQGMTLDRDTFSRHLSEQQRRAREARAASGEGGRARSSYPAAENLETLFTGYEHLEEEAEIKLLLVDGEPRNTAGEGDSVELFLDRTPFYAEAGGQVGDSGIIETAQGRAVIARAFFTPGGQIVHEGRVERGRLSTGDPVSARVEHTRRRGVCRSHTATHLLHRALKETLGEHVNQAGSLVSPDRLRFDFNHFKALSPEEQRRIEKSVNSRVLENLPVTAERMTLAEAESCGATALFTEKYDAGTVRVVSAGAYSKELCGGTHVQATGEIGLFRLLSEEGIGSGLRRIEALTGMESYRSAAAAGDLLDSIALLLKAAPDQLPQKTEELLQVNRDLEHSNRRLKERLHGYTIQELLAGVETVEGVNVLSAAVKAGSMDELRAMSDLLRERLPSLVAVLGAIHEGRVLLVGAVTADLVDRGLQANQIISAAARRVGGGGGGRPEMAQAGGKNPAALPEALQLVRDMVRSKLASGGDN